VACLGRDTNASAEFQGLCLLCTYPGHCVIDCRTGLACLHCGEVGHMLRECSLPGLPRPRSPDDGNEPARKRVNENGLGHRVDDGAIGHRARVPGCHGTTCKDRGRDACVTRACSYGESRARGCEKGCGAVLEGGTA
jgi:hypothetical protein